MAPYYAALSTEPKSQSGGHATLRLPESELADGLVDIHGSQKQCQQVRTEHECIHQALSNPLLYPQYGLYGLMDFEQCSATVSVCHSLLCLGSRNDSLRHSVFLPDYAISISA